MQLCRISFKRAKSLISLAQNDDYLFTCIGDKIMVNSFKDKTTKYNRKGQAYHSDYCYKYPVAKNQFRTIVNYPRTKDSWASWAAQVSLLISPHALISAVPAVCKL